MGINKVILPMTTHREDFSWLIHIAFLYVPAASDETTGIIEVDYFGVIAYSSCIVGNIFCNHAARSDGDIITDSYILHNTYIGADIGIITYNCSFISVASNCCKLR